MTDAQNGIPKSWIDLASNRRYAIDNVNVNTKQKIKNRFLRVSVNFGSDWRGEQMPNVW